mmetsp:Transcript_20161/g.27243  ORF Transcript_20161/g.27243 Transcript_20161/m.27243 type:complete len:87 (+) Transcript_20161:1541-1801(+)
MIHWPSDLPFFVHLQPSAVIVKSDYQEKLQDYEDRQVREVEVRMLDLTWFFAEKKNFEAFTTMLQGLSNKAYSSELVEYVLDQFWA